MSNPDNANKLESLSALMDGECSELELRRTLKAAAESEELSETWRRYHLVQTLLKGQAVESKIDISAGVMAAIDTEESQAKFEPKTQSDWWQGAASMAAAASVTLAVLLGVQQYSADADPAAVQQAGVIERAGASSALLPTSLTGSATDNVVSAPAIEVIRLSEDMRNSISAYQNTAALMTAPNWQPNWLPDGYLSAGVQIDGDTTTRLYSDSNALLTLAVAPVTEGSPAAGSYSQEGVIALGRVVDQHFVSLVGKLSLDEADRVISSLQWGETQSH